MNTIEAKKAKLKSFLPFLYDIIVPAAVYFSLHYFGVADLLALTIAGGVSGINAIVDIIRHRKFRSVSLLVFIMFGVSIAMMIFIKDPRIILLKPAIFIEVGAIYCFISTFKRPLIMDGVQPMATDGNPEKIELWKQAWLDNTLFKKRIRIANVLVSIAIALEGVSRAYIAFHLSLQKAVIYSNLPIILLFVFFALLGRFYMRKTAELAFNKA